MTSDEIRKELQRKEQRKRKHQLIDDLDMDEVVEGGNKRRNYQKPDDTAEFEDTEPLQPALVVMRKTMRLM